MATSTGLFMVTDEQLAALLKEPTSINDLKPKKGEAYSTYLYTVVNYFLCGDAWPSGKKPLVLALNGEKNVECSTLENGSFDYVPSKSVGAVADALAKVDLDDVKEKIEAADFESLRDEEEVDMEEVLTDSEDPTGEILGDIESLAAFYKDAKNKKRAIVMYTS